MVKITSTYIKSCILLKFIHARLMRRMKVKKYVRIVASRSLCLLFYVCMYILLKASVEVSMEVSIIICNNVKPTSCFRNLPQVCYWKIGERTMQSSLMKYSEYLYLIPLQNSIFTSPIYSDLWGSSDIGKNAQRSSVYNIGRKMLHERSLCRIFNFLRICAIS